MGTSRLESFSDGVIAVAITLLVLDLVVPTGTAHPLASYLSREWPDYVAYGISFVTVGIIWINHHVMIGRLRAADHFVLLLNLLLLMSIVLLPFTTALMAKYLQASGGEHLAAGIYAGSLLLMSVLFFALHVHILRRSDLLREDLSEAQRTKILRRNFAGLTPYALALALAVVSPYITLAITGAVAVFYAMPISIDEP